MGIYKAKIITIYGPSDIWRPALKPFIFQISATAAKAISLSLTYKDTGAMNKSKENINLISNEDQKQLDICINGRHNGPLSDKCLIRLVKLLARQAAEEDYLTSIIRNQGSGR